MLNFFKHPVVQSTSQGTLRTISWYQYKLDLIKGILQSILCFLGHHKKTSKDSHYCIHCGIRLHYGHKGYSN